MSSLHSDYTVVHRRIIQTPRDAAVVVFLATLAAITTGTWVTGQLAGLLWHRTWPPVPFSDGLSIAVSVPGHWADPRQAWPAPARATLPGPAGFAASAVLVLGATLTVVLTATRWIAGRRQVRGWASRVQLDRALSESAALAKLPRLRPGLTAPPPPRRLGLLARASSRTVKAVTATPDADQPGHRPMATAGEAYTPSRRLPARVQEVAVDLGRAIGSRMRLHCSIENSVLLLAAPRQGKTSQIIIPWLHHWPGPALCTSVRRDVVMSTLPLREKVGPVAVMDLTGTIWPCPLSWSPTEDCEDYGKARERADVMVRVGKPGTGAADSTNAGFFGLTSTNLLAAWLHAAAVTGRTMADPLRWGLDERNDEPIRLLRDHPDATEGVATMLDNIYRSPVETRSNLWTTALTAITPLLSRAARNVFCPPAGQSLNIEEFLAASGTAYLTVSDKQAGDLAPLIAAFVDEMTGTAIRMAEASGSGRLDPPLGLILDEAANVSPLPELPQMMSYLAGFGVFGVAVLQNVAQARDRWGHNGADSLWGNTTLKIALGGLAGEELDAFAKLAGQYRETVVTTQYSDHGATEQATLLDRQTILPHEIRTLREDRREALIIHATTPAVRTRMVRHYEGPDAAAYASSVRDVARRLRATAKAARRSEAAS